MLGGGPVGAGPVAVDGGGDAERLGAAGLVAASTCRVWWGVQPIRAQVSWKVGVRPLVVLKGRTAAVTAVRSDLREGTVPGREGVRPVEAGVTGRRDWG